MGPEVYVGVTGRAVPSSLMKTQLCDVLSKQELGCVPHQWSRVGAALKSKGELQGRSNYAGSALRLETSQGGTQLPALLQPLLLSHRSASMKGKQAAHKG